MTDWHFPSHTDPMDKPIEDECVMCGLVNGVTMMALAGCLVWLGWRLGGLLLAWAAQ